MVIGAGAVGALLAGQLHLAGVDVVLVARGAHLTAIRSGGLRIRRPRTQDVVELPVVAGPDEVELTPSDVLVLTTKTQDAQGAFEQWAWQPVAGGLLGADLPILTFQNGLATEGLALRWFSQVYGVSIAVSASYLVPGEVLCGSEPVLGVTWTGHYPVPSAGVDDPALESVVADLGRAGFASHAVASHAVASITSWKAQKLLSNVGFNGIDLLAGSDEEHDRARGLLIAEAREVYAAAGITLPAADLAQAQLSALKVEPMPGAGGDEWLHASTWQSFTRGGTSELDWLNGEIVRLARLHGTSAPLSERLQRLLGAQAQAGKPAGTHSIADLLDAPG